MHTSKDHDEFAHHVRDAPVLEAVAELTDVDAEFRQGPPPPDQLHIHTALETKVRRYSVWHGCGAVWCWWALIPGFRWTCPARRFRHLLLQQCCRHHHRRRRPQDRLAAHGVRLPEEEALWREELEEGVARTLSS